MPSDVPAPERSAREVVDCLRSVLGVRLVAYVAGVATTRQVHAWAEGRARVPRGLERRLRAALTAAEAIADSDGRAVAQIWFQGRQPELGGASAARALRDNASDEVAGRVLMAALAFLAGEGRSG